MNAQQTSPPIEGTRPLDGVRVLDIATFIAGPFCAAVLAEFGADVIKIEQPGEGDPLRRFGTKTECGDTLIWMNEARNKRCATLDLRTPEGAQIFRDLVAKVDVVVENFRPGTLERWGVGYESLRTINPRVVMLRISAYGQDGPFATKPGFARIAHGFSGLSFLAGEENGPPVVPGSTSIADYTSGLWGAFGIMMALRTAERTGRGQMVDIGLYESVFRIMDELVPDFAKNGTVRRRMGADVPFVVPHGHWRCGDGNWIALACSSDKMFERFADAMGRPAVAEDPRFATNADRVRHRDQVTAMITDWCSGLTSEEATASCDRAGVPCGPILSIDQIMEHPQYKARGNFEPVNDPRVADLVLPSAMPRLSETPGRLTHAGRALGADTEEILGELLGLDGAAIAELRKRRVA